MSSSLIIGQLNAMDKISNEPWPEDAQLYQPYEAEQILLPESASCLAVKTYLKMCRLPYEVRLASNAEFMSPGGRMTKLPFLRAGAFLFAEFEPIVGFVEQKGLGIGDWLQEEQRQDMRAYVTLVENIFTMAELYVSFAEPRVYAQVTAPRNGWPYPWPLNHLQNYHKRRHALRVLKVYQWHDLKLEEVIEKVEKCCETLTWRLRESKTSFFYGDKPCELDAVAFGHLFSILTLQLPMNALAQTVLKYEPLREFCQRVEAEYFHTQSL